MKRVLVWILILIQAGIPLIAQEIYEGISVQGYPGEFPAEGYYAASNTFPQNTRVRLTNPATGAVIEVIITGRISGQGIFLVLSDDAARALGMQEDMPLSLVASPVVSTGTSSSVVDVPFSVDPEVNPGAEFSDPNEFVYDRNAETPEVVNPLLSAATTSNQANSSSDPATASQDSEPDVVLDNTGEPVEITGGYVLGESTEEEAAELPAEAPSESTEENTSETSVATNTSEPEESENPRGDTQATNSTAGAATGLGSGIRQIADNGIGDEQPATGNEAVRSTESPVEAEETTATTITTPAVTSSRGILSALSRIQQGTNAVSPEFTIEQPDYSFWPEEYNADTVGLETAEVPQPELEGSETEALPNTAENIAQDTSIADTSVADESVVETAVEETAVAETSGEEAEEYAEPLGYDPGAAWIERIRSLYPNRQLFLPPIESDLDNPLPHVSSDTEIADTGELAEAGSPIEADDFPDAGMSMASAAGSDIADRGLPEIGYDFDSDMPHADLLPFTQAAEARIAVESLAQPVVSEEEAIEVNDMQLAAPAPGLPEGYIPLASYSESLPTAGLAGLRADRSDVSVASTPVPQVPGEEIIDPSLPVASAGESADPTISHEPQEKVYGIEAGILRLGPASAEVAANPPEPSEEAAAEEVPAETETTAAVAIDPNAGPETVLPEGAIVSTSLSMEEADFRSPELVNPENDLNPELADGRSGDGVPEGFVLISPDEAAAIAAAEPSETPLANADAEESPVVDPEVTEEPYVVDTVVQTPEEVQPAEELGGDEEKDGGSLLVYLEESEARSPSDTEATPEVVEPEEPVAEEPAEVVEQTPVTIVATVPDLAWAQANLPLVYNLVSGGYYLQVGAFANPRSAKRVVEEVAPGFPLAVLPVNQGDKQVYRVFVGPLTEDEKGTVLYWFRARGYKDAFIRQGI